MTEFKLLINGRLVDGKGSTDVLNPATEMVVAQCPRASHEQLDQAVAAAREAFPAWKASGHDRRRAALAAIADRIEEHAETLARLLTLEQGKPLTAAQAEVAGTAAFFRYFSAVEVTDEVLVDEPGQRVEVRHVPLGVIGAIVPWNYPLQLMAFKVPVALLVGNTVVLKPAATTPLATLKFAELAADLLPDGVLNVIADANDLGAAMSSHPGIDKISFTGSTETGRRVMAGAAPTLKRLTLELGGNDAAIVLDDIDIDRTVPALFESAFTNSGQVCIAIKRLYVHETIYDQVCDRLAVLANEAVVGDGLEQGTLFGPIQNKAQYDRVIDLIDDARACGTIIAGSVPDGSGYFVRPTIVRDIEDGTRLVDEEQFGPVLPVIRFAREDDVVSRANASAFGLGASIWSGSLERAMAVADQIEAGTVWINKHLDLSPAIPFGGTKQSGLGTELGREGVGEFTQVKVLNVASCFMPELSVGRISGTCALTEADAGSDAAKNFGSNGPTDIPRPSLQR